MFNKDNIIAGIGSVVNLFGIQSSNRYDDSTDEHDASSDYNALKSDWAAIGNDMSQAMELFWSKTNQLRNIKMSQHFKMLLLCGVIASTVFWVPWRAFSHSGGTDSMGGHYNRKTGTYHYHNLGRARSTLSPRPSNDVWVNSYFRKDGTYVRGHWRTYPDGNPYNNYSTPKRIPSITEIILQTSQDIPSTPEILAAISRKNNQNKRAIQRQLEIEKQILELRLELHLLQKQIALMKSNQSTYRKSSKRDALTTYKQKSQHIQRTSKQKIQHDNWEANRKLDDWRANKQKIIKQFGKEFYDIGLSVYSKSANR